jgi:hypothetical protein
MIEEFLSINDIRPSSHPSSAKVRQEDTCDPWKLDHHACIL